MATRTLAVSKDTLLVHKNSTGNDWGAGKDHHLFVGKISYANYKGRFAIQFTMPDWDGLGITKVTGATLKMKVSEAHTATGSSPLFDLRYINESWSEGTWGGQGGGDPSDETWSDNGATNSNWPGPSSNSTTPAPITVSLGSASQGEWVSINVLSMVEEWAPSYVQQNNGSPGGGRTNYGLIAISDNDASESRVIEFWSSESSFAPYITLTYETSVAPTAPAITAPANATVVASTTPTVTFSSNQPIATYDIRVSHGAGPTIDWEALAQTSGVSGSTASRVVAVALTRGTAYSFRVRTKNSAGQWSPYTTITATINSSTPPTVTEPGASSIVPKVVFQSGWNTPRLEVSLAYTDAEGHAQVAHRVRVLNTTVAGAPGTTLYDTGRIANAVNKVVIPADLTNGNYYLIDATTEDSMGLESAFSTVRHVRVRWAVGAYYMDTDPGPPPGVRGTPPTAWTFDYSSTSGTASAVYVEYASSTGTGAPGTYVASQGGLTLQRYFHYRVWLMAWGSATPTTPALLSATLAYQTVAQAIDGWVLGAGSSLDKSEAYYGTRTLKITASGYSFQGNVAQGQNPILLLKDTEYRLSGRIKVQGAANGRIYIADQNNVLIGSADAVNGVEGWQHVSFAFNSGSITSVYIQPWQNGGAGTASWFDALQLEASTIVSRWHPSAVGRGVAVDAGGVQIDGVSDAVFRLFGGAGGERDIVELGATGLKFGGDSQLSSPYAGVLQAGDGISSPVEIVSAYPKNSGGQFRAISGAAGYGFMIRMDGSRVYFLLTASGDPYGIYTAARPLYIDNATGAVTLGTGANVNGVPIGTAGKQILTTPTGGTFAKPTCNALMVEVMGGGGGGGGAPATTASQGAAGAGGGGGGYSRKVFTGSELAALPSSIPYTVGAAGTAGTGTAGNVAGTGGTTTFNNGGAIVPTGAGGTGGEGGTATTTGNAASPGLGGAGSGGDLNIAGSDGGAGRVVSAGPAYTAFGGSSHFAGLAAALSAGSVGSPYGGGAGGIQNAPSQAAKAGQAGAVGVIFVTWW